MIRRMIAVGLCGVFGLVLAPGCDELGLGTGGCGGTGGDGAVCEIVAQSPCDQKCEAEYNDAALTCGAIEIEADRKTCQDGAHETYKNCRQGCQQSNDCRKACEDKAEACEAGCRKLPKDDKAGRQKCWTGCNSAYADCIKKC